MIFLQGCTYPELMGNMSNKMLNILVNKSEKSIFLVGDRYTYVYQNKPEYTGYKAGQYKVMENLVNLLKDSKGFSFVEKPKVNTVERKMLDGTTDISSSISLYVEIEPTQKQIDYFKTGKGYRGKNYGYYYLNGLRVNYKKTKCFLGNCDDRYVEYIISYSSSGVDTIKTTPEMKRIESRLHKNIVAQVKVAKTNERTKEEVEKSRKEMIKRKHNNRKYAQAINLSVMIPIMIAAIPIVLPFAVINSK